MLALSLPALFGCWLVLVLAPDPQMLRFESRDLWLALVLSAVAAPSVLIVWGFGTLIRAYAALGDDDSSTDPD